jgi:hypothetical protein
MKTFKEFVNEQSGYSPKDEIQELEKIHGVKIVNLQNAGLGGWIGVISIDETEYQFDVNDNIGDWEYKIFDFPTGDVLSFPNDDKHGIEGDIEDIKDQIEHYFGI